MVALARRLGAEVLVTGHGTAATASNTMGGSVNAVEAVVEARAFDVQTGQPIGGTGQKTVVSGLDAVVGGRDALAGAGALAGDDLGRQIIAVWKQAQDRR